MFQQLLCRIDNWKRTRAVRKDFAKEAQIRVYEECLRNLWYEKEQDLDEWQLDILRMAAKIAYGLGLSCVDLVTRFACMKEKPHDL